MATIGYSDCPHPDALRTGDLLFPRLPTQTLEAVIESRNKEVATFGLGLVDGNQSVRDLINWHLVGFQSSSPSDVLGPEALMPKYAAHLSAQPWDGSQPKAEPGVLGMDDWRVMSLLMKVMAAEMSDLFEEWLNMPVKAFIKSALGKFLFTLLKSDATTEENFFVGHMAMVFREDKGQVLAGDSTAGTAYVIEANITDFSHYRVAMHPYWVDDGPTPAPHTHRGWANRRLAEKQKIWMARPKACEGAAQAPEFQRALVAHAKRWLGRPYGFFDAPEFGEPDRMYCAEYLYRVFLDASLSVGGTKPVKLDSNRTWGWMLAYFKSSNQTRLHGLLADLMNQKSFNPDRAFFVLTPAMVWCSATLCDHANPEKEAPYCAPVPGSH